MSIAKKYVEVMKSCGYVQKNGMNTFHKYKYATAADVLEKINEACVEVGIATPVKVEVISAVDTVTAKGNAEKLVTVKVEYTLICTETGETLTITGIGSGQDAGDKAVMKAETAAAKYAWMLGMNMATGDDPEADTSTDEKMNNVAVTKPTTQKTTTQKTTFKPKQATDNTITFGKYTGKTLEEVVKTDRGYVEQVAKGNWQGFGALATEILKATAEPPKSDLIIEDYPF